MIEFSIVLYTHAYLLCYAIVRTQRGVYATNWRISHGKYLIYYNFIKWVNEIEIYYYTLIKWQAETKYLFIYLFRTENIKYLCVFIAFVVQAASVWLATKLLGWM